MPSEHLQSALILITKHYVLIACVACNIGISLLSLTVFRIHFFRNLPPLSNTSKFLTELILLYKHNHILFYLFSCYIFCFNVYIEQVKQSVDLELKVACMVQCQI